MSDPADDIMRATYCALCERGYADLTMRDIAEQADRSKASLHYHYESKHGLMVAFLEFLNDEFFTRVGAIDVDDVDDPHAHLRRFLDDVLHPPHDGETAREFRTALLEIKAQAPYDEDYRERLAVFDDHVFETVRDLVSVGVERGVYREDVDPEEIARFVVTLIDGAQSRHVVVDEEITSVQGTLEAYLEAQLRPSREVPS